MGLVQETWPIDGGPVADMHGATIKKKAFMGLHAGLMVIVKEQDGHDDGFRSLHSCIAGGSRGRSGIRIMVLGRLVLELLAGHERSI